MMRVLDGRRPSMLDMHDMLGIRVPPGCSVGFEAAIEGGPAVAEQFFRDWEAEVRRTVPADRLLVCSAKEGWAPLCRHLGLPVPVCPYPRVNDTASIQRLVRRQHTSMARRQMKWRSPNLIAHAFNYQKNIAYSLDVSA